MGSFLAGLFVDVASRMAGEVRDEYVCKSANLHVMTKVQPLVTIQKIYAVEAVLLSPRAGLLTCICTHPSILPPFWKPHLETVLPSKLPVLRILDCPLAYEADVSHTYLTLLLSAYYTLPYWLMGLQPVHLSVKFAHFWSLCNARIKLVVSTPLSPI